MNMLKAADPFGGFRDCMYGRSPKVAVGQTWAIVPCQGDGREKTTRDTPELEETEGDIGGNDDGIELVVYASTNQPCWISRLSIQRKVLGVFTPWCACGEARETAFFVFCERSGCDEEDDNGDEEVEKP